MACLQSFDPLPGGLPVSKNSSSSLKEDCKDDRVRRQQETLTQCEGNSDTVEQPAYPFSQRWWWVENQGASSHRTFISAGDRYEMVSFDSEPCNPWYLHGSSCHLEVSKGPRIQQQQFEGR